MSSSPLLIFDLDGTLLDTAPDLVSSLNHVLAREGFSEMPIDKARMLIGQGARAMLQYGFELYGAKIGKTQLESLFKDFLHHYEQHIIDQTRPFPGLLSALSALQAQGWRFAVCTNKMEHLARQILEKLALTPWFAAVTGGDSFAHKKPHKEPLLKTVERAGSAPERSIMIGDSQSDIGAARAAGLPVIAVDFGYTPIPVEQLGPDRIISHFDELPGAVSEIAASKLAL